METKEPKVGEVEKIIKECCQYCDRIDKQINCRNDVIKQINQLIDSSRESAKREEREMILQKVGTILKPQFLSEKDLAGQMKYCDGRVSAINEVIKIVQSKIGGGK